MRVIFLFDLLSCSSSIWPLLHWNPAMSFWNSCNEVALEMHPHNASQRAQMQHTHCVWQLLVRIHQCQQRGVQTTCSNVACWIGQQVAGCKHPNVDLCLIFSLEGWCSVIKQWIGCSVRGGVLPKPFPALNAAAVNAVLFSVAEELWTAGAQDQGVLQQPALQFLVQPHWHVAREVMCGLSKFTDNE